MGKNTGRILGIVPIKSNSTRFPNKNYHLIDNIPMWYRAYSLLRATCTTTITCGDAEKIHKHDYGAYNIQRPPKLDDLSVLEVLKHAYNIFKSNGTEYESIMCLFPNTIEFTEQDIEEAIDLLKMPNIQEVRGFHWDGIENGLLGFKTKRLFNPPGISSYLSCVVCAGREIHYQEELKDYEQ